MKPRLMLVHGNGAGAEELVGLEQALSGDYSVSNFARPGWDGSAPPPRGAYYRTQGEALLKVLGEGEPAAVLGWSSGCFAVLHAALLAPSRFRALALYEPPLWARSDSDPRAMLTFMRFALWSALGRRVAARRTFWRMVTVRADGRTGFDALSPAQRDALENREGPLQHEVFSGTGEELKGSLGGLQGPLVVLRGADSAPYIIRGAERLHAQVPTSVLTVVPNADHLHPVSRPDAFAAAVRRALNSIDVD